MNLRSITELVEVFDDDLGWRKRELTTAKLHLARLREHERSTFLRACVCLLYAHWEGFLKTAATAYVGYVAKQGLKLAELTPNFVALGLRSRFVALEATRRVAIHTEIAELMLSGLRIPADLPWETSIDTRSNANSDVLREIAVLTGVDYTPYATKQLLIDGKLLYYRNAIAHGNRLEIQSIDYEELHAEIITLLDQFRTDLENAAVLRRFVRG